MYAVALGVSLTCAMPRFERPGQRNGSNLPISEPISELATRCSVERLAEETTHPTTRSGTMPFRSEAQRRHFEANKAQLEKQGVNVKEWEQSSKGLKLPELASKSYFKGPRA
jgi:hypothetical protein